MEAEAEAEASQPQSQSEKVAAAAAVPYTIPPWSAAPCHRFYLEVLKDGSIIDQFQVNEKGAYMFGRVDLCDFVLDHPSVSRFHASILHFPISAHSSYSNLTILDSLV